MKPADLNLAEITEFDLNLAKNDRALVLAKEIVNLSVEARAQKLQQLQQKIAAGAASLFEENVLTKLLEDRAAEKIGVIRQNLAFIEAEFKKRPAAIEKPGIPPQSSPTTRLARAEESPSDLLTFLASQKPPVPPTKKAAEQPKSRFIASVPGKKPVVWATKDLVVSAVFVLVLALAIWYSIRSKESPPPTTFDRQAAARSAQSAGAKETSPALQTQFDDAAQQLRFGAFDQGKTQLLNLIQNHPQSAQAEDAYLAIADTYRQRQHNPAEALKYYQTFTAQYPQSPRIGLVQLKMGFAYEDLEDSGNAAEMYRLILKQHGEKSRVGQLANERLNALKIPAQ